MEMVIILLAIMNLGLLNFGDFQRIFRIFTAFSSILLSIFYCCSTAIRKSITPYIKNTIKWHFLFITFILIEIVYGTVCGTYGFLHSLGESYMYFCTLLFYPVIYVLVNDGFEFIKKICALTVAAILVKSVVWWLYNYKGKDVMHYLMFEFGGEWVRNGFQRIPATAFSGLLFSLSLYYFLSTKERWKKIACLIICLLNFWYANFVFMSRAQMISFVITTVIMILVKRRASWQYGIVYIFVSIAIILFINSNIFLEFMNSLSKNTFSIGIRFEAFNYYTKLFQRYPWFGFSFIVSDSSISGSQGFYYTSDMGLLGSLFEIGIVGFALVVYPLVRMLYIAIRQTAYKYDDGCFSLGLIVYTIISSALSNNIWLFMGNSG